MIKKTQRINRFIILSFTWLALVSFASTEGKLIQGKLISESSVFVFDVGEHEGKPLSLEDYNSQFELYSLILEQWNSLDDHTKKKRVSMVKHKLNFQAEKLSYNLVDSREEELKLIFEILSLISEKEFKRITVTVEH